jgi:Fic family protein
MTTLSPLHKLKPTRFESPAILKKMAAASRSLAELKGVAATIPNQGILINTLGLQEAKDSSAIENIITTHDELYREDDPTPGQVGATAKEVLRYRQALKLGFERVSDTGLLTLNTVIEIQRELESNRAGFRKLPGTVLKDNSGKTVYTPPQDANEVKRLMGELEKFWHNDPEFDVDPLIRMALIHHQFESIHPFYDGNGRTGRIVNVLYLVKEQLLDIPVLSLSRHIARTKSEYYRLLQSVRVQDTWEEWVMYMLTAIDVTASETVSTIQSIRTLLMKTKQKIRADYKFYSQDLLNNLFSHPYTKIEFIQNELNVSRLTATKYLDALVAGGVLHKRKLGRSNYYVNAALFKILTGAERT